jgi:hypothetical protein
MKKTIITLSALTLVFASCEDYNDQFDIQTTFDDVNEIALTLEKSDYSAIANNKSNLQLAAGLDGETTAYSDALAKIASDGFFNELATADVYIPAFLADKYPYAGDGSKFVVTYNNYVGQSAYMTDFVDIESYTLTEEAYNEVWGERVEAFYLSPKSESKLPKILETNIENADKDDIMVVNYAYSDLEPSVGGGSAAVEPTWTEIATIPVRAAGNSWNFFNTGVIDLSEYVGQTVNIGFKYTSTDSEAATWEIKNFVASAVPYLNVYAYAKQEDGSSKKVTKQSDIKQGEFIFAALAADGKYYPWGRITNDKSYGYMAPDGITITDDVIPAGVAEDFIVQLDSAYDGFAIKNSLGKYLYLKGTYDSYNVMDSLVSDEETGSIWAITSTGADRFEITNVLKNKCVKLNYYNGNYSFGAYADTKYKGGDYVRLALTDNDAEGFTTNDIELGSLSYIWTLDNKYGYKASAYKGGAIPSESWLISPAFTIDESAALPYFSYDEAINKGSVQNLTIWISTDYNLAAGNKALKADNEIKPTKSVIYRYDGEQWTAYTNKDVMVALLQPSDYTAINDTKIANPDMVLPIYLADKYPYAESGTNVVTLYVNAKNTYTAAEYTLKDGAWTKVSETAAETTTFMKENGQIEANLSSFYENTLLGDEGGFTVQNITLGNGLSYVWSNTTSYGWKATGYYNNTNNISEAYAVSPLITLKKAQKPTLTFDEAHRYLNGADPNSYFEVLVSTDYKGDVTTCTWDKLDVPTWSDGSNWDFVNIGNIDLSKYNNQSIVIALKYRSDETAAATWEFKNFRVVEESVLGE